MSPAKTRRPFVLAGWKHRLQGAVEPIKALGDIHCRIDEPLLVRALVPAVGRPRTAASLDKLYHAKHRPVRLDTKLSRDVSGRPPLLLVCLQRRRPKGAAEVAADAGELAWRCRGLLRQLRPHGSSSNEPSSTQPSMAAAGPGSSTTGGSASARSLIAQGSYTGVDAAAEASGGISMHVVCDKACQTPHLLRCCAGSWERGVAPPQAARSGCSWGANVCRAGAGPAGGSCHMARYHRADVGIKQQQQQHGLDGAQASYRRRPRCSSDEWCLPSYASGGPPAAEP